MKAAAIRLIFVAPCWRAIFFEPPPSTVFVLATTEPQKVLATVIDRCHRFDFQRPTTQATTGFPKSTPCS